MKTRIIPHLFFLLLLVALYHMASAVNATGFRLPDQDAFAAARGEAFVATADNASAIYYNPAGIAQLQGHNVRVGTYALYLQSSYTSPDGRSFDNTEDLHAIPQLFYAFGHSELPLSLGVGLYSPYGLSSHWPDDTGFRTVATEGILEYYTVNPVVAWRVSQSLSVGAGLTINYAELDLRKGLVWPTQPWDEFRFKGDGLDFGYNIGLLWKLHEKISFGANFRSITTVDLDGRTEYFNAVEIPGVFPAFPKQRVEASAEFPFPFSAVLGVSYRPTPNWNFEFDAEYTDWNRLNTVVVKQAASFSPLIPQNLPLVLDWEGSWYYEFGITRYINDAWSISLGYIFNENSVPDKTYSPIVADLDRHFVSIGAGYARDNFNIDLTYQFGYGPARKVSGSQASATGQTADGEYEFVSHALMVSIGLKF
ncbi:MAG: outer membrane protein transport protein [Verrucomicrobiae bacterium]|nr:outer membrane protein transport protein [Verrucomicrobiae bacterium]